MVQPERGDGKRDIVACSKRPLTSDVVVPGSMPKVPGRLGTVAGIVTVVRTCPGSGEYGGVAPVKLARSAQAGRQRATVHRRASAHDHDIRGSRQQVGSAAAVPAGSVTRLPFRGTSASESFKSKHRDIWVALLCCTSHEDDVYVYPRSIWDIDR